MCAAVQVSFVGARITPDGRTAILMSARTLTDFQSTGLHRQLLPNLFADFHSITDVVFDGTVSDASHTIRSQSQSLYLWVGIFVTIRRQVYVQPPQSVVSVTLPAFACCTARLMHGACPLRAPAAIDRYLLPAGRSAANQSAAVAAVDRRDRQTDGQTLDRSVDPPSHTMRAVSQCQWLSSRNSKAPQSFKCRRLG